MSNNKAYSYLRFSTPDQIKGDSFRRQSELSRRYADEHGLELDEALTFNDLGVSAFRGANAQEGQLGAFLTAVDQGKVRPGSTLLVESLDRLSRQSPYLAFRQLDSILRRGVKVVTLQDRKVYDAEQGELAFTDLMMSLMVMQRAHEESLTKSNRGKEAWKAKRDAAAGGQRKLTGICPNWLTLDKEKQEFVVDEDRAAIVRRIFDMTIDGMGNRAIAATLNTEGVPPFGSSAGWSHDYIRRILENEAVIGRFQPHKRKIVNGKQVRVPVGEVIDSYFPPLVQPETFFKAMRMRKGRKIAAGRASKAFSNLFTGMVICGVCGAPMYYENKGKPPKGGSYLVCSHARMNLGCKRHSWRYPQAQSHVVMNINELDYREMFPDMIAKSQAAISKISDKIMVKEEELESVQDSLERLTDLLLKRDSSPTLLSRLDVLEEDKATLEADLASLKLNLDNERDRMSNASGDYGDAEDALGRYVKVEREGSPKDILTARRRFHQLLQRIVDKITFIPSCGDDGFHGVIEITFQGVEGYLRRIKVLKGQANSKGYKVIGGAETNDVMVLDAQWPPRDRIISAGHVIDQVY
jgi:DNA invertase Pin-like site-specific DNA recombinase